MQRTQGGCDFRRGGLWNVFTVKICRLAENNFHAKIGMMQQNLQTLCATGAKSAPDVASADGASRRGAAPGFQPLKGCQPL
jgi:hypothetical protein